jgi:murein L,D-transpeptidase YcbB/YkuD
MLVRFYEGRAYRPAWYRDSGPLSHADILISTIQEEAEKEGLNPGDYRLKKLKTLLSEVRHVQETRKAQDARKLADLDLLLTDTFLTYGAHVSVSQKNLDVLDERWFEKHGETDLVQVLQAALDADQIAQSLKALPPQQLDYRQLRQALAQYRQIAANGGWPSIPPGPSLQKGDQGERVTRLSDRLRVSGDFPLTTINNDELFDPSSSILQEISDNHPVVQAVFDEHLEQAVQRFQQRHGLPVTGVANAETLVVLNVSADVRAKQIAKNLERWRKLPQDLGQRYIAVNIPNFTLDVVEQDEPVLDMRVVVGKMMQKQKTPTFSAQMTYLVLNPYWLVPKSIAEKELFPLSRKNPKYFAKNDFIVKRIPLEEKQILDPNAPDGSMITEKTYEYQLRQKPGPKNALGRIKFMFPNPFSVYLHDTPSKDLFKRTVRTYSHGCIRIEKPLELAEYVLRGSEKWTRNTIDAALIKRKEQTVWLPESIPVYIQYWTAWVDADGMLQFRDDIYGYDGLPSARHIKKAHNKPTPEANPKPKPEAQGDPQLVPQPSPQPLGQPEPQLTM